MKVEKNYDPSQQMDVQHAVQPYIKYTIIMPLYREFGVIFNILEMTLSIFALKLTTNNEYIKKSTVITSRSNQ